VNSKRGQLADSTREPQATPCEATTTAIAHKNLEEADEDNKMGDIKT
jgi:hypothetical protein